MKNSHLLLLIYVLWTAWFWWRTHDLVRVLSEGLPPLRKILFYSFLLTWPVSMFALPGIIRIRRYLDERHLS
jgi:hypothetical protein